MSSISSEVVEKAKTDFRKFVKSTHFETIAGPLNRVKSTLEDIYNDKNGPNNFVFEIIQSAVEEGCLEKSVVQIYSADGDKISFAKDIIRHANQKEKQRMLHRSNSVVVISGTSQLGKPVKVHRASSIYSIE